MYRFYKSCPCNLLYYNELQGVLFRLQIWISLTLLPNFALLEFHEIYFFQLTTSCMIKELLVSTALLCSASLSFSYCMGEDRIVVERKMVKSTNRPHRAPEQLPIDCIYNDVMSQVEVQFRIAVESATVKLTNQMRRQT